MPGSNTNYYNVINGNTDNSVNVFFRRVREHAKHPSAKLRKHLGGSVDQRGSNQEVFDVSRIRRDEIREMLIEIFFNIRVHAHFDPDNRIGYVTPDVYKQLPNARQSPERIGGNWLSIRSEFLTHWPGHPGHLNTSTNVIRPKEILDYITNYVKEFVGYSRIKYGLHGNTARRTFHETFEAKVNANHDVYRAQMQRVDNIYRALEAYYFKPGAPVNLSLILRAIAAFTNCFYHEVFESPADLTVCHASCHKAGRGRGRR